MNLARLRRSSAERRREVPVSKGREVSRRPSPPREPIPATPNCNASLPKPTATSLIHADAIWGGSPATCHARPPTWPRRGLKTISLCTFLGLSIFNRKWYKFWTFQLSKLFLFVVEIQKIFMRLRFSLEDISKIFVNGPNIECKIQIGNLSGVYECMKSQVDKTIDRKRWIKDSSLKLLRQWNSKILRVHAFKPLFSSKRNRKPRNFILHFLENVFYTLKRSRYTESY